MRSARKPFARLGYKNSPNYRKVEPSVLSPKTITSDFVYPASALMRIIPLRVCCRINVRIIIYVAKFGVVLCWAIFELPLVRRDVMSRN